MKHALINTLIHLSSRRDTSGNVYHAFTYADHATGKMVRGMADGESNVRSIMLELNGGNWEPRNIQYMSRELAIREFNRTTKDWEYAGCRGEELVAFIRHKLAKACMPVAESLETTVRASDNLEANDEGKVLVFCLLNQPHEDGGYWHRVGVDFGARGTNYERNWYHAENTLGNTAGTARALYNKLAALPVISRADVKRARMFLS